VIRGRMPVWCAAANFARPTLVVVMISVMVLFL